jgi:hypothetical protein
MDIIFLSENKAISLKILAIMEAQVKAMSEDLVLPKSWTQVEVVAGEARLLQASFKLSNSLEVTLHFPHTTQLLEAVRKQVGLTQPSYCAVFRTITDDGHQPRLTVENNQSQIHFGMEHMALPCTEEDERVLRKNTTEFLNHCIRDLLQLNPVPAAVPATDHSNPGTSAPVLDIAHSNVLSPEVVPYVPDVMPDPLSSNDGFDGQLRANLVDAQVAQRENAANITHVRGEIQQLITSMEALMRNQSRLETSEITRQESEMLRQKRQLEGQLGGLQAEASMLQEKVIQCHKALQTVQRVRQQPQLQRVSQVDVSVGDDVALQQLNSSPSYYVPPSPGPQAVSSPAPARFSSLYADLLPSSSAPVPAGSQPDAVSAVSSSTTALLAQPRGQLHRLLCAYIQRQLLRLQDQAIHDPDLIKADPLRVREWAECRIEWDFVEAACEAVAQAKEVTVFSKQQTELKEKLSVQLGKLNPCVWDKKAGHSQLTRAVKIAVLGYLLDSLQGRLAPSVYDAALMNFIEAQQSAAITEGLKQQGLAILQHQASEMSNYVLVHYNSAVKKLPVPPASNANMQSPYLAGFQEAMGKRYGLVVDDNTRASLALNVMYKANDKLKAYLEGLPLASSLASIPQFAASVCDAEVLLRHLVDAHHPLNKILGETRVIKVGETTTIAGFYKLSKCQGKFDRLGDDFSDVLESATVIAHASILSNAKERAQYLSLNFVVLKRSESFKHAVAQALGRFIINTLERYHVEHKTAKGHKAEALGSKINALTTAQQRLNAPTQDDSAVKLLADLLTSYHSNFSLLWQPRKSGGTPTIIKDLLAFRDKINKPEYADVKEGQVVFSGLGSAFEPAKVGKAGMFRAGEVPAGGQEVAYSGEKFGF